MTGTLDHLGRWGAPRYGPGTALIPLIGTDAGTVLSILGKYIRILGKYIWTGLGHDPKIALSAQILDTHSRIDIIISQRRLRCHWRPGHPGHHGVSQSAYHLATAGDAAQLGCGEGGRRLNKDAMRRLGGSTRKGTSRCQMQAPALPNLRVYPPCQMLAPWGLDLAADGSCGRPHHVPASSASR